MDVSVTFYSWNFEIPCSIVNILQGLDSIYASAYAKAMNPSTNYGAFA